MIKRLIIAILLCAPSFAAVCTSQATGNWDVISWSCGHAPTTADSTVIATGNTVTVENGLTTAKTTGITFSGTNPTLVVASGGVLNAGTLVENGATVLTHIASGGTANLGTNTGTSLTTDVTITLGTFSLDNGGNLNLTGTLKSGPTGTANLNGHTIITPNGPGIHQDIVCNSSSTGSSQLNIVGASHGSPAVVETATGQSAGGNSIIGTTAGSSVCDVTITHAILNNIGDTTNASLNYVTQTNPGSFNITDVLMIHSGKITTTTNSGVSNVSTFSVNGLDIRNPNAAGNIVWALGSTNTTVPSAPRNITNVTCDSEVFTGTLQQISVGGSNFNFGSSTLFPSSAGSDSAGINWLNCTLPMTGVNNVEENFFTANDDTSTGAVAVNINNMTNNFLQNSVFYEHENNAHSVTGATAGSSTANSVTFNLYDGDFWHPGDCGTLCVQGGTSTCSENILINGNGNLSNNIATATAMSEDHNLLWNQCGASLGEGLVNALQVTQYYDNLFPCPLCIVDGTTFPISNNCSEYMSGVDQESAWVPQTNFNEDYNWKFNFPYEGDPLSNGTCVTSKGGTLYPFLGIFASPNGAFRGPTANLTNVVSTAGTGTGCPGSSCEFDFATGGFTSGTGVQVVQVNDVLYDDTKATWTTINTVSSNTKVLVNNGTVGNMTTVTSGDHFSIMMGIWADHTAIAGATNRGSHDLHGNPILFNAGASTCTWFNTLGNALTCPTTIAANGRTDTNILAIAHAAVSINGWDYGSAGSLTGTNCASNCPAPVTPWGHTATDLLKYMGQQYKVYNGAAKNSGHSGTDVGPAWRDNYPPAMLSF